MALDIADDELDRRLDRQRARVDRELGRGRRLVGGGDSRELGQFAGACAAVEPLGIAAFAGRKVDAQVDFVEGGACRGASPSRRGWC